MMSLIIVRAILGSNGEGKLQSASLLGRAVTRCFVFIPLARFPFLLSQVSKICVFPEENHMFLKIKGHRLEADFSNSLYFLWKPYILANEGYPRGGPISQKAYISCVKPILFNAASREVREAIS